MVALHPFSSVFVPVVEIAAIAAVLYYLLSFFWNTRAMDVFFGMAVFLLLYYLVSWLHFPVLERLMSSVAGVALLTIFILFQPELRLALSKFTFKGRKAEEVGGFDKFLDHLSNSVYKMADRRIGAIIVLENHDVLDEYATKGVMLQASFSSELIESIFATTSPLHDGAVIIRGITIIAASVILPLADESSQISRSMGTRHRAALGISQIRDALCIVISEEKGIVSLARDGIMTKNVKPDRFKGILRSIFHPPQMESRRGFALEDWFKPWKES